jgi:hypothetical protein
MEYDSKYEWETIHTSIKFSDNDIGRVVMVPFSNEEIFYFLLKKKGRWYFEPILRRCFDGTILRSNTIPESLNSVYLTSNDYNTGMSCMYYYLILSQSESLLWKLEYGI